ncbi:MAG: hypothetical protein GWP04_07810 [Gammaproteobacteria bacterium]|nr:hypothetical protein [Gammaproteobacteria bacterium]
MKRLLATAAVLVLTVAATGCGAAAEKVSEKVAEKAIEQAGGGSVDIQQSGSGDNAVIKVESEEGTMIIGGGEIPESLTVPVPDGGEVTGSVSAPDAVTVSIAYPKGDYDAIVEFYDDWTGSRDYEKNSFSTEDGDLKVRSTMWFSNDGNTSITVSDGCTMTSADETGVCVMIIESS